MKHKTWFRLVLKAIGVLLMGLAVPSLAQAVGAFAYLFTETGLSPMYPDSYWLVQGAYYLGGILQLLVGLYLFFGGAWIVNKAIPSNRPYCPECGYDLSRSKGAQCPECGVALPYRGEEPPR